MSRLKGYLAAFRTLLTILAGAAVGVLLMVVYLQLDPPAGKYNDSEIRALAGEQIKASTPTPPIEPQIYAQLLPSVVVVSAGSPDPAQGSSVGSGVVVDLNGSILTAYHVVNGFDTVTVQFYDGSTATGTVTQKQPERDLAIISVNALPKGVDAATLAGGVHAGDEVMAIGAPFGLAFSASSGIVSALGRSFYVAETGQELNDMIQFDAAINPGNSGGPLVDMNGHVVGIVTGILSPDPNITPSFAGISFAVPIEQASGLVAPVG